MKIKHFQRAFLGIVGFFVVTVGVSAVNAERPRLVGLGCGPERETLVAVEEDDLPAPCYVVDTPQNLCGVASATECAAYLGEGY
jgi:hypothetical protein